jgi:hypothetical protein
MSNLMIFGLMGLVAVGAAIVLLSFLVEAMRPVPPTPERLSWAPDIPIRYVSRQQAPVAVQPRRMEIEPKGRSCRRPPPMNARHRVRK